MLVIEASAPTTRQHHRTHVAVRLCQSLTFDSTFWPLGGRAEENLGQTTTDCVLCPVGVGLWMESKIGVHGPSQLGARSREWGFYRLIEQFSTK